MASNDPWLQIFIFYTFGIYTKSIKKHIPWVWSGYNDLFLTNKIQQNDGMSLLWLDYHTKDNDFLLLESSTQFSWHACLPEASCHVGEEVNFDFNKEVSNPEKEYFLSQACEMTIPKSVADWSRGPSSAFPTLLTHKNCSIINVCCFKSLWSVVIFYSATANEYV